MPEPVFLSWAQVGAWRMQRQFLERLDGPNAVEIARRLCGIQAQVPSAAALAVAVPVLDHTGDESLAEHLASGWSAVLKPLAWQGLLCQGPSSSGRVTFVRPDLWFSDWPGLPAPDDAAPMVIRAYLGAFGPSSAAAFDQWLIRGATPKAQLRGWFSALVVPAFDQFMLGPGTSDEHILPIPDLFKPTTTASPRAGPSASADAGAGAGVGVVSARKLATEVKRLTKLLSAVPVPT